MKISKDEAKLYLLQMYQTRAFELQAEKSYMAGKIHGTMHLSLGQEASAIGAVSALAPNDYLLGHHRGHGLCIAKGANIDLMMSEFYGKENGYCRGRGGSMHIADMEGRNLGANGVVGGGLPMAVGVGIGLKMKKEGDVVMCFFGDGAASTGAFHESMILAKLYNVPLVYVCENNQYAMSFPADKWTNSENLAARAEFYGMPGVSVNGNDLLAVKKVAHMAVDRARNGDGPSLIVNDTYRWRGHSKSDRNRYRSNEEIESWKEKDPILAFKDLAIQKKWMTKKEAEEIEKAAYGNIESSRQFAEASPEPSLDTIEEGVYAP